MEPLFGTSDEYLNRNVLFPYRGVSLPGHEEACENCKKLGVRMHCHNPDCNDVMDITESCGRRSCRTGFLRYAAVTARRIAPTIWAKYKRLDVAGQLLGPLRHAVLAPYRNPVLEAALSQKPQYLRATFKSILQGAADYLLKRSTEPCGGMLVMHPYHYQAGYWHRMPHFHLVGTCRLPPQQIIGAFPGAWEFGSVYKSIRQLDSRAHAFGVIRYELGHAGYIPGYRDPAMIQFGWARGYFWYHRKERDETIIQHTRCPLCQQPHHTYHEHDLQYDHKIFNPSVTVREKRRRTEYHFPKMCEEEEVFGLPRAEIDELCFSGNNLYTGIDEEINDA